MNIPELTIIGAGKLGQTLGRLFHVNQCFKINGVCNSSITSAQEATRFIGAGLACSSLDQLPPSDVILIATPDAVMEDRVLSLKNRAILNQCQLIFHCSGAIPSAVLSPIKSPTFSIASVHPNMTFASPQDSVNDFSGTYCAFEGEEAAWTMLDSAFRKIGGHVFRIDADKKALYHAAASISCNHLVALLEVAVQLYLKIGVSREVALSIMQPIVGKTIDNVMKFGTVGALTGPIARGDVQTVRSHMDALENTEFTDIYKDLGRQLIKLSEEKGITDKKRLDEIMALFF